MALGVSIALSFITSRYSGFCEVLYAPFKAGRVIDVSPGRRAKRLPLVTFCRASGARRVSLMSLAGSDCPFHGPEVQETQSRCGRCMGRRFGSGLFNRQGLGR